MEIGEVAQNPTTKARSHGPLPREEPGTTGSRVTGDPGRRNFHVEESDSRQGLSTSRRSSKGECWGRLDEGEQCPTDIGLAGV